MPFPFVQLHGLRFDEHGNLVSIVPAAPAEPEAVTDGPLSSWKDVAAALGVAESTIRAHRKRTGDKTLPLFACADEAREWYRTLVGRVAPRKPPPRDKQKRFRATGNRPAPTPPSTPKPRKVQNKQGLTSGVDWSKTKV